MERRREFNGRLGVTAIAIMTAVLTLQLGSGAQSAVPYTHHRSQRQQQQTYQRSQMTNSAHTGHVASATHSATHYRDSKPAKQSHEVFVQQWQPINSAGGPMHKPNTGHGASKAASGTPPTHSPKYKANQPGG